MLALVLSRRDFRESDQMISFYTEEFGKTNLLARGVKKIISKNSAHLEPFSLVEIEVANGREVDHLTKVVPIEYFKNIREDLEKSLAAGYVVNFVDKVFKVGEKDDRVFKLLINWFNFVNLKSSILNLQLIDGFMVELLQTLGYDILQEGKKLAELNHKEIYNFAVFHLESKINDWGNLTPHQNGTGLDTFLG